MRAFYWLGWLFGLVLLAGCATRPMPVAEPSLQLTPVGFADLPGWMQDNIAAIAPALEATCQRIMRRNPDNPATSPAITLDTRQMQQICANRPDAAANAALWRAWFQGNFIPYAASDAASGARDGLFTGYYEAQLSGSRKPFPGAVPLYRPPPEMGGERPLRPYYSRAEIVAGALNGRGLELAYVDDPVAAFFLQIQGSGRIRLREGGEMRVGYAAQNGHGYRAIGKDLIAMNAIPAAEISMQSIKSWLRANPDKAELVMNKNPSYVFFQELTGAGPLGAEGVPLTPGRSLAVDRRFMPYGLPVWLVAEPPFAGADPIARLLMAQDTGGAIRGVIRGDVFWGHGELAERLAGPMRSRGRYWIFLPRGGGVS